MLHGADARHDPRKDAHRVPVLWTLLDQIVDRITQLCVGAGVGVCVHGRNRLIRTVRVAENVGWHVPGK